MEDMTVRNRSSLRKTTMEYTCALPSFNSFGIPSQWEPGSSSGFSFEDLDLLYGFRHARMALGGNAQPLEPRHFGVMALSDPDRETVVTLHLLMRYGIQPVFFLNRTKNFA